MNRRRTIVVLLALIVVPITFIYWSRLNYFDRTVHSGNIWVVIEDSEGNLIAIDSPNTNNIEWDELVRLNQNKTEVFIGGAIEQYDNKWGFRFKPDSIAISPFVPNVVQGAIKQISSNLNYWKTLRTVYIYVKVVEIHILVPFRS